MGIVRPQTIALCSLPPPLLFLIVQMRKKILQIQVITPEFSFQLDLRGACGVRTIPSTAL